MPSIQVEYNTDHQNAQRFPVWMALCVFSIISLVAVCTTTDKDDRGTNDKWVIAVTAVSMGFSFIAVLLYLFMRGVFVGQIPEAAVVCTHKLHSIPQKTFLLVVNLCVCFLFTHACIFYYTGAIVDCLLGCWFAGHYESQQ